MARGVRSLIRFIIYQILSSSSAVWQKEKASSNSKMIKDNLQPYFICVCSLVLQRLTCYFLSFFFLMFMFFIFIYLFLLFYFLAALGLCCCARAFSSCSERGLLFVVVCGLLIAVASLVAKHGL